MAPPLLRAAVVAAIGATLRAPTTLLRGSGLGPAALPLLPVPRSGLSCGAGAQAPPLPAVAALCSSMVGSSVGEEKGMPPTDGPIYQNKSSDLTLGIIAGVDSRN